MLLVLLVTCTSGPSGPRADTIAFLFDGRPDDADLSTGPALAGLELAARRGGVDVEPVNVGEDPAAVHDLLDALSDDRAVVGAVVAPWTAAPDGAAEALAEAEIPVVSLSWAWGPASVGGAWRSLAVDEASEGMLLLEAAARVQLRGPACVSGDGGATGRSLTAQLTRLAGTRGAIDVTDIGTVEPERPATADAVAGRLDDLRCGVVVWVGGVEAADLLVRATRPPTIIGTSRLKNDEALTMAIESRARVDTVCGCVDVTLTRTPSLQRFVHDVQASSAAPPGPYAVEAYDAGRMLLELLRTGGGTREDVAGGVRALTSFRGLVRDYRFVSDGTLAPGIQSGGWWRAFGSRWLPIRLR